MHFDGYLINVECPLTADEVAVLIEWLSLLRSQLKSCMPHSLLIWYDAVTIDGTLIWQNALNTKNKPFFDVCDGIFLNYAWDQTAASASSFLAGSRSCDMFLGVDVFGRGTFGGGKFNSHAASAIAQVFHQKYFFFLVSFAQIVGCSLAVFAPGWTHECTPDGMDIDEYASPARCSHNCYIPPGPTRPSVANLCCGWGTSGDL
jgi:mannosyl-glycoprotein endo-beta-N-acetylglucosaminidase